MDGRGVQADSSRTQVRWEHVHHGGVERSHVGEQQQHGDEQARPENCRRARQNRRHGKGQRGDERPAREAEVGVGKAARQPVAQLTADDGAQESRHQQQGAEDGAGRGHAQAALAHEIGGHPRAQAAHGKGEDSLSCHVEEEAGPPA